MCTWLIEVGRLEDTESTSDGETYTYCKYTKPIGLDKPKKIQREIVNISYPSVLPYVMGAQKNRLIKTVLLSTHNICFG